METLKENLSQEFANPFVQKKTEEIIKSVLDIGKTSGRIRMVLISGCMILAITIYFAFIEKNVLALGILFVAYICVTVYEKVAYGFGVIAYKKVIQRLLVDGDYRDSCIETLNLCEQEENESSKIGKDKGEVV